MEDLTDAWRLSDAPEETHSDDGYWVHVSEGIFPELEAMGLSIPVPKPAPKKRGSVRANEKSHEGDADVFLDLDCL